MTASKTPPPPSLEEKLRAAGIKWTVDVVKVANIHANPWNPNRQDDRTKQATRESIATFGFLEMPTVRAHPELDGHYQIINGEHRVIEARELDFTELPVVVVDVDTPTAMKLTVVLNQGGENDNVALGALLGELKAQMGENWTTALAFDSSTLEHLLELGAQEWDPSGYGAGAGGGIEPGDDGEEPWLDLQARVPESVMRLIGEARDAAGERGELREHEDPAVAMGLFLEVLAASYLADAERERDAQEDEGE